jgi:hypothetical protein
MEKSAHRDAVLVGDDRSAPMKYDRLKFLRTVKPEYFRRWLRRDYRAR